MKKKGIMVAAFLFCFGFFYQSTAFSKWVSDTSQPVVKEIGHNRTKQHNLITVLSYLMINSFDTNPYLTPSDVVESDDSTIQLLAATLTEGKSSDFEKSKAIYTWITENIEYDAEYYYQVQNLSEFEFDSALETLERRMSMCMGYAHLNAALHRASGIETKVVYGNRHAWNEVLLDGDWSCQDSTKGEGYIDSRSKQFVSAPTEKYFGVACSQKDGEYLW